MMKLMIFASAVLTATSVFAADAPAEIPLSDQLRMLEMPANQAPDHVSREKLYAVQTRYVPLKSRFELSLGGAQNLTGDGFLTTRDAKAGVRFHLSDRWSLALEGSKVFNELNSSGDRLLSQTGNLPDAAIAKYRADLAVTYNLFYGKFRLSMDRVFYFDQYVSLGGGVVGLEKGDQRSIVGEAGLAFWFGRNASVRFGLKDYFYTEVREKSEGSRHNLLAHLSFGWLLGGGSR